VETQVFRCIRSLHGSISAEHGIGKLKKADLHYSRSEFELSIMRGIKSVLDPHGIMNPGKIF
jgi:FAD/FMN-containing dehydrogenase